MKNRTHVRGLAIIAITLAAALSACGSTSSTTSGQKNNPSASSSNASSQDANLIFAQCKREKGFDVPDTGLTPDNAKDTSAGFNAAVNECMAKTDGLTGQDDLTKDPAARDALVKGAQCLRDLGYNVKDPEPGKGVDIQDVPQDALNKCFGNPGGSK